MMDIGAAGPKRVVFQVADVHKASCSTAASRGSQSQGVSATSTMWWHILNTFSRSALPSCEEGPCITAWGRGLLRLVRLRNGAGAPGPQWTHTSYGWKVSLADACSPAYMRLQCNCGCGGVAARAVAVALSPSVGSVELLPPRHGCVLGPRDAWAVGSGGQLPIGIRIPVWPAWGLHGLRGSVRWTTPSLSRRAFVQIAGISDGSSSPAILGSEASSFTRSSVSWIRAGRLRAESFRPRHSRSASEPGEPGLEWPTAMLTRSSGGVAARRARWGRPSHL